MRSLILVAAMATLIPTAVFVAPIAAQAHHWRDGGDWRADRYHRRERAHWREARREYWRDGWAYRHRHHDHYREYGWRDGPRDYRW